MQAFSLNGWFTDNITNLVKKFVTKVEKVPATYTKETYHTTLRTLLKKYYSAEGLCVIGSFYNAAKKEL